MLRGVDEKFVSGEPVESDDFSRYIGSELALRRKCDNRVKFDRRPRFSFSCKRGEEDMLADEIDLRNSDFVEVPGVKLFLRSKAESPTWKTISKCSHIKRKLFDVPVLLVIYQPIQSMLCLFVICHSGGRLHAVHTRRQAHH